MEPEVPFSSLHRILAVRLDNIGDVVMTGPALRALRQAYPRAHITLMASTGGVQVAPMLPWVDDALPWDAVWQNIGKDVPVLPERELELAAMLEAKQFDAVFVFTSFGQSPYPPAYAAYMARIPLRIGQSKEFGGALLTHWVRPLPDTVYQVTRNLHLLRSVGIPVESEELALATRPEDAETAAAILLEAGIEPGAPFIALAPGASAAARRYDDTRFARAAQTFIAETGLPVVLLGPAREIGRFPALEALSAAQPGAVSLMGRTTVAEMGAVIRRSALLIANNSGSMHIAAAFRRPMVILYAGTELYEQWAPRTTNATILNRPTFCAPCHLFQCAYQHECLDISPEEVVQAALLALRQGEDHVQPLFGASYPSEA